MGAFHGRRYTKMVGAMSLVIVVVVLDLGELWMFKCTGRVEARMECGNRDCQNGSE